MENNTMVDLQGDFVRQSVVK